MPPRRSSRVASASLETAPIEPLQSKRKRGQTIEPDNEEKENVAKPASRTRRSVSARPSVPPPPKKRKTRSPTRKTQVAAVIEDSDEDIEAPPSAQPPSKPNESIDEVHSVAPTTPPVEEVEEEEEEKSLFDPPPMPGPSSLPQVVPEEPTGPKSRLVIHKLALINFKSYAGRQEIGPFHKVTNIGQAPVTMTDLFNACSHFPLSLVPMGLENPILSMLSYSYSDTVLPR